MSNHISGCQVLGKAAWRSWVVSLRSQLLLICRHMWAVSIWLMMSIDVHLRHLLLKFVILFKFIEVVLTWGTASTIGHFITSRSLVIDWWLKISVGRHWPGLLDILIDVFPLEAISIASISCVMIEDGRLILAFWRSIFNACCYVSLVVSTFASPIDVMGEQWPIF